MKLRNFKYVALNEQNKPIKGRIEAINRAVCIKYLETKNYQVKSITEYRNILTDLRQMSFGRILTQKQMIFFLRQLGALLNAGVSLLSTLELLAIQQEKRQFRALIFELYQALYNGFSLSQAMATRKKDFPSLLVQMIEIGEMSGDLAKTVLKMADYYEKQMKVTSDIKGAVRMPLIYLTAAIVIAVGMTLFVFPNITNLFLSFEGAQLPGITRFFLSASSFMSHNALPIFGGLALVILAVLLLNRFSPAFRYRFSELMLKLPIIGRLLQMNQQILIADSLSEMLSNGIPTLKALQTIHRFLRNVVYKKILENTMDNVEEGKPFSKAFVESPFIDPIMARMIQTGEKTGDIPHLMENLAAYYSGITEIRVDQIKNAIQPILLVLVYIIVGVMILAIVLPMISLGGQI